ncbi:MAG: hypothetical protein HY905_20855, partial [Deltaproteobacteria bacterium]|nr:hypothetical protein [Deltaproteobacteria bacterium]
CAAEPACGGERQPCCSGDACRSGLVCERSSCVPPAACGGSRQPCCGGTACASGLVCEGGTCNTAPSCGGPRQPCCSGTACNEGLVCDGGTCNTAPDACGTLGQPCCSGTTCTEAGASCCGGACTDTDRDPRNCGTCGNRCSGSCTGGTCEAAPCGAEGEACCSTGERCRSGLDCNASDRCERSASCTPAGEACSGGGCCTGLSCRASPEDSLCCVEANGTCTSSADCCGWMSCVAGRCACQPGSDICTLTDDCCAGLTCTGDACTSTAPADPCGDSAACDPCTGRASCGWCDDDASCRTGSISGPSTGSCTGWSWLASSCGGSTTDPCNDHDSCDACTAVLDCGWCAASATCVQGAGAGPAAGSCDDWRWYSASCTTPADPCATSDSCGTCTIEAGCGWCDDGTGCLSGTSSGPAAGSCTAWTWLPSACATDECAGTTDCESCTTTGSCGWCGDSWTCLSGGPTRPDVGACADWNYYAEDCAPPPDPCDAHGDCDACTGDAACGWCDSSWACLTGGPSGPDAGSCSDWRYSTSECAPPPDPCNDLLDCAACTGDSACGWCEDSWTCITGGSSGPDAGSCYDWRYLSTEC